MATWIKEGDLNIMYFHAMLKYRLRKNNFLGVNSSEGRIESVEEVKEEVRKLFKDRFTEVSWNRPFLE